MRRTRVMPFVHLATAMPLDVVLAGSGLEEEFLDRARPVDVEDALKLWRIRGRDLDAGRILRTLRLLEEALSQSDLLPVFGSIVRGGSAGV